MNVLYNVLCRVSLKRCLFFLGVGLFLMSCSKEHIDPEIPSDKPDKPKPQEPFIIKDKRFKEQWYLQNTGQKKGFVKGLDINVVPVWKAGFTGKGIAVGVMDALADYNHPELKDNLPLKNVISYFGGLAAYCKNSHGTSVASLIGAKADEEGMRGVAYESELFNYGVTRDDNMPTPTPKENVKRMFENVKNVLQRPERTKIAVYNASIGPTGREYIYTHLPDDLIRLIDDVTENGFNGKGSGIVFAAGNGAFLGTPSNNAFANHHPHSRRKHDKTKKWGGYRKRCT